MLPLVVVQEVRRLLDERELSQRKIASKLKISRGTIGAIASGRRGMYGREPDLGKPNCRLSAAEDAARRSTSRAYCAVPASIWCVKSYCKICQYSAALPNRATMLALHSFIQQHTRIAMSQLQRKGIPPLVVLTCSLLSQCCFAESIDEQFMALVDEIWQCDVREDPLLATSTGDHRYNDRLPSISVADSSRRHQARRKFSDRVQALDRGQLSSAMRIDDLAEFDFQTHLIPITQRNGFHIEFPELPKDVPLKTTADYENYSARLRAFGDYTDGHIELLRAGIAAGQTLPAVVLEGWEKAIDAQIVERPTLSLLYEPCKKFPSTLPAEVHARLRGRNQCSDC